MQPPTLPDRSSILSQERLLRRITHQIRRSPGLQEILTVAVAEIRAFLGTDRVKIYQFHEDSSGQVVGEAIFENRLPSLLGLNFPAEDIPPHIRQLFIESRLRSIVDVTARLIGQSPLRDLETGEIIFTDIQYRPLDPCHAEYLTAMGVKSSLVVPIFHQEQLWGLLVSHHSEPYEFPSADLWAVQAAVDQLSVGITQATLLAQARDRAQREATINRIITLLHSLKTVELQKALEETVEALQGSGGRLFINGEAFDFHNGDPGSNSQIEGRKINAVLPDCPIRLYTCGQQPLISPVSHYALMEQYSVWENHFQSNDPHPWPIPDIYQVSHLRNLQSAFRHTPIRSILMIPLWHHQQIWGYLSIFRDEIETETLWAGQLAPDSRQLYPRLSFDLWCETKRGQLQDWTPEDLELARSLGSHFATAVQHYEMNQRLQTLNASLEGQVQERTAELERSVEQQRILFEVVTKMRQSLDLDTIFQTTTQEVCELLKGDRVAVYQFTADWGGKFVGNFEYAHPVWPQPDQNDAWLNSKTVWNDTCLQATQGGRFRNGETYVVDNINEVALSSCHLKTLGDYQIQSFLLAPIFVGKTLWGLLAVYHAHPRHWEALEIQFVVQVATQLGIALEQAELLAQTRQQALQQAQTLQELQQTQTQLIQTEKMSSLGQLVAGVAHEINNPVNFIYGNLTYINSYAKDLLALLKLYQQQFPEVGAEIRTHAETIDLDFLAQDLPRILSSMELGTDRIRQIVASLRNFSRHDQAEMKSVNLHDGIDNTLLILQHRLGSSHYPTIEIVKQYGEIPLVDCYSGQFNQVLMNVLSNAIDALISRFMTNPLPQTNDAPQIKIHTEVVEGDRIAIRIADNGIGMTEAVQRRLFDPFFTTKPVGAGTGLGLSISYQIVVERHNGILRCLSIPNQGTEFAIEIPIRQG